MQEPLTPDYFLSQDSFKNWANGINQEDCVYWDAWLAENPSHLPMATLAAALVTGLTRVMENEPTDEEVRNELNRLRRRINNHQDTPEAKQVIMGQWWRVAVAASVAAILSSGIFWFLNKPYEVSYAANTNERKTIHLTDGTEVVINNNTKMTALAKWRFGAVREVWLEGEAYFKVMPHPESAELRDFVVHTHDLDIKVIGTEFNVDTRFNRTSVVLDEGKVQLNLNQPRKDSAIILTPGQAAEYSTQLGTTSVKAESKIKHVGDWRFGYYNFNKTTLKDVISLIEDRNQVQIKVEDQAMLAETITGRIPNNNLDQAMTSLAKLFKVDYVRNDAEIVLKRKAIKQ